jgi:hypothetical protein
MRIQLLPFFCCLVVLLSFSCTRPDAAKPGALIEDACSLLTNEQVQRVIGQEVKESIPSHQEEGGFFLSQCQYNTAAISDSVTVRLVQRGRGDDARDPKEVWQETFARDLKQAEERRKKAPPERVPNVGDEAYWLGGPKIGGLYVLKGNRHFRIGLGGEANQAQKIEKASELARVILQRL